MLLWLMNIGFAGGGSAPAPTPVAYLRKRGAPRPIFRAAAIVMGVLFG
jgi:hypothetical protein